MVDAKYQGGSPLRTCIGCRRVSPVAELVRLVMAGERVVTDPRRRRPGRGASIHPLLDCVDGASKKGGFARAFRRQVAMGAPGELWLEIQASFASSRGATATRNRNHS
jgi:predicted RNA-binding protein YlxR (DUF448 family)